MYLSFKGFGAMVVAVVSGFALKDNNRAVNRLHYDSDISYRLKQVLKDNPKKVFSEKYGEAAKYWVDGIDREERKEALYAMWQSGVIDIQVKRVLTSYEVGLIDMANGVLRKKINVIMDSEEIPLLREVLNDDIAYVGCIKALRALDKHGSLDYKKLKCYARQGNNKLGSSVFLKAIEVMAGVRFSLIVCYSVFTGLSGAVHVPINSIAIGKMGMKTKISDDLFFKSKKNPSVKKGL